MSADWYPGIRAFCAYWVDAPMLQQTYATLEKEFIENNDACIDASKALVECACRLIIDELDDPVAPLKPVGTDPKISALVGIATRLLKLGDIRHRKFADLIKHHNNLTDSLRELRNEAGTVSHGKDVFLAKLSEHHRRAAALSADAIVSFLHSAYLDLDPDPTRSSEPYERFEGTNLLIDKQCSLEAASDDDGTPMFVVRLPDGDSIELSVETSRLLFALDREAYKQAALAAKSAGALSGSASGEDQ